MNFFKKIGKVIYACGGFFKSLGQYARGLWHVYDLPKPIVTVFGGHHVSQEDEYARRAYQLASRLIEHSISVITGGGPGIMQAANCGVEYVKDRRGGARTLGIGVSYLRGEEEGLNPCAFVVMVDQLYTRKLLLIDYSIGFVVFPGGVGTINELSELLTLMDVGHIKRVPIVLIGTAFWQPFVDWVKLAQVRHLIHPEAIGFFTVTDDIDQAIEVLVRSCGGMQTKS